MDERLLAGLQTILRANPERARAAKGIAEWIAGVRRYRWVGLYDVTPHRNRHDCLHRHNAASVPTISELPGALRGSRLGRGSPECWKRSGRRAVAYHVWNNAVGDHRSCAFG